MKKMIGENRYGVYSLPSDSLDRPACQRIQHGEIHEQDTIDYIIQYAGKGTVIHAGAYFGDMLPALSRYCKWVIAFEPVARHFECAKETIELNQLRNVELIYGALTDVHDKPIAILTKFQMTNESRGGMSKIDTLGDELSRAIRLDDLLINKNGISIVHLDIEHHEKWAISGMRKIIEINRPVIISETPILNILPNYSVDKMINGNIAYIPIEMKGS